MPKTKTTAQKPRRSQPKAAASRSLGTRKAGPMPFKDVVQRLLEAPPEPKKR